MSPGDEPNTEIVPESGRVNRTIALTTVDLPAPFGPKRPKACPSSSLNETPSTAQGSRGRYRLRRSRTSSTAAMDPESRRDLCRIYDSGPADKAACRAVFFHLAN